MHEMDNPIVTKFNTDALDLKTLLTQLGLDQYGDCLKENGFEDWETVQEIRETDLIELGFKLGDRRKLQRAIREYRISSAPKTEPSSQQGTRTTRSYRRHPRPDRNAPVKPKTAYVLFSEHVRQDPALSHSSFADIAKETGRRWRQLSPEERKNAWERPAAGRLQDYKEELAQYKQTDSHRIYQTYLDKFKEGQSNPELAPLIDSAASTSETAPLAWLPASMCEDEFEAISQDESRTELSGSEDQWRDVTPPVKSGMEAAHRCLSSLGFNPRVLRVAAFPPEDMTMRAVKAFLRGTGSLLFFWDQNEALDLVRSVYHPQHDSVPAHATEVFAMSAVGSYCDGESNHLFVREQFLQFFLLMLCSPSHLCDLRRMRLFACLALCRFTSDVESARTLICKRLVILTKYMAR